MSAWSACTGTIEFYSAGHLTRLSELPVLAYLQGTLRSGFPKITPAELIASEFNFDKPSPEQCFERRRRGLASMTAYLFADRCARRNGAAG
jgi:hypothetical protein